MKNSRILLILSFLFGIFTICQSQNLSLSNHISASSINGCEPSSAFGFQLNNTFDYIPTDIIHLSWGLVSGIELNTVTVTSGGPGIVTMTGLNSVEITGISNTSTISISYQLNLNCTFSNPSSQNITHNVDYSLNQDANQTSNPVYYLVNQASIEMQSGTNLIVNNAILNSVFTRTYTFKNVGSSVFNGYFNFFHNANNQSQSTIQYNSIGLGVVSAGVNVSIVNSTVQNNGVSMKLNVVNLDAGDEFTITETAQVIGCQPSAINTTAGTFEAFYGCNEPDAEICLETNYNQNNYTEVNLDLSLVPNIEILTDPELIDCISESNHRTLKIRNNGNGPASSARFEFNLPVILPDTYNANSYYLDGIDLQTLSASVGGNQVMSSQIIVTPQNGTTNFYITIQETIPVGDIVTVDYDILTNCIDEVNYPLYFDKKAILHVFDHPLLARLFNPCVSSQNPENDSDFEYYNGAINHPQQLQQSFTSLVGQMSDGYDAWFNIDNSTPLVLGNQNGDSYRVPYDLNHTELIVQLKVENGLIFQPDPLNGNTLLNQIYLSSTSNIQLLPASVNIFPGNGIGTGDLVIAKFTIPANWFSSPVIYDQDEFSETNNLFAQFFNSFKVNFRLTADCPLAPSNGVVHILQEFFVNPTPQCEDCLIPLAKVTTNTNINCPGCVFPGWNLTQFTFERKTIGTADSNNDHIPEVGLADLNLINLQAAMVGDVIEGHISGFLSDGQVFDGNGNTVGFTFSSAETNYGYMNLFDEAMLHFTSSGNDAVIDALEFISAECTLYFHNSPPQTFTIPLADYGTSSIGLQLSVAQLANYGVNFNDYSEVSNIEIHPRFRITRNLDDCPNGNPYYGDRRVNCFLHMGGSPFTAQGLENSVYADATNPTTNTYLLNHTNEWEGNFKFWCTSFEGRFLGVGIDSKTINVSAENVKIDAGDLCQKRLNYMYGVSIGKEYEHSIDNPQNFGINQTSASIFHHEVRSINSHNLIKFNYPIEYEPAFLNFRKFLPANNPSTNLHSWQNTLVVLNQQSSSLSISQGALSFDPSLVIPFNEENQVYFMDLYLDPISCSQINEVIPYTNNQVEISLEDATSNSITELWNPLGIESYSLAVNTSNLNSNSFNNVQPDFTLTSGNNGVLGGQNFWNFSLTTGADPNVMNWTANDFITESADNVFITFDAPSYFSNLSLINNVSTFENGNQSLTNPTLVQGWVDSFNAYELDYIGVNFNAQKYITKSFTVAADVNCTGLTPGQVISFDIIIGWGCGTYPTDISNACYSEKFTVFYTVPDISLQVVFNHEDDIPACSVTDASIEFYSSPVGMETLEILIEQQPGFTFVQNSAYITNNGYISSSLQPVQNGNNLVWNISNINDPNSEIYGGNMIFHYQLQLECGAENIDEFLLTTVSAESYCGGNFAIITDDWLPQVLSSNDPIPDNLTFSIEPIVVNDCSSGTTITIQVTNEGINPTGNLNSATLLVPADFSYVGTDPSVTFQQGGIEIQLPGNLSPNATHTFVLPFEINSISSCQQSVQLIANLQESYICNNVPCLTEITQGANLTQSIAINTEICNPNALFTAESLCITNGGITFNSVSTDGMHSWSFNNMTSNVANPYFPITQGGTFTVIHTFTNDCGYSDTYSENVFISELPTLSIVNPIYSICQGEDIELTVTSNSSVSWLPQPTSISPDGLTAYYSAPQPGPGLTFDITISASNSCGTVQQELSITVKDDCFPVICNIQGATTISNGTTNVSGITCQINSDITISGNVIYDNSTIYIGTGYSIIVPNNQTLTLRHCHLLACKEMWKGIIVQVGGNLIIEKDCWIEDAESAVYISSPSDGVPPTLKVDGAIFNKNFIGITVNDFVLPNVNVIYPNIMVRNAVFTNRELNNWNTAISYRSLTNTNTLSERCMIDNFTPANLLAPHVSDQAKCGIFLNQVGAYNGINYFGILIGASDGHAPIGSSTNLFDNLRTGILASDANFIVSNSVFQEPAIQFSNNEEEGVGVYATTNYSNSNKITIAPAVMLFESQYGKNFFYDMKTAVRVKKYKEVDILFNDIRSTQTGQQDVGEFGIDVLQTVNFSPIRLNSNMIRNTRTGISFKVQASQNTILTGPIRIDKNIIQPGMLAGVIPSGTFVEQGIHARYSPSNSLPSANPENLVISNNLLSDVYNGIRAESWRSSQVLTRQNTIIMRADQFSDLDFGIIHSNCFNDRVHMNTISSLSTLDDFMNGIYSDANTRNEVTCNTTDGMGRGIVYSGNHGQSVFRGNVMSNHLKAFVLTNNAVLLTQGSITNASDNRWLGSTWNAGAGFYQTYTEGNSSASNAILFVRDASTYKPTVHGFQAGSSSYTNSGLLATVKLTSSGVPYYACIAKKNQEVNNLDELTSINSTEIYHLYPNPAQNELNISCLDPSILNSNISIYDMFGKKVFNSQIVFMNGASKIQLDLSGGVYLIHVLDVDSGKTTIQRIVVNN